MVEASKVVFHRVNYCLPVEAILPLLAARNAVGTPPRPGLSVSAVARDAQLWAGQLQGDKEFTAVWCMAVTRGPHDLPQARL